jgi:hypothetical protein
VTNNIKTCNLLKELKSILKSYKFTPEEILLHVERIVREFRKGGYLKYRLDEKAYLILCLDERKLNKFKRYSHSPFPLLSNVVLFRNCVGSWNEELESYGLSIRYKLGDGSPATEVGSRIHLAYYNSENSRCNKYLREQYKRLEQMRTQRNTKAY